MKAMHRPAIILEGNDQLNEEMRSARWLHHRLLDFEDEHQRLLDATAEEAAPGIVRAGRIVARLQRRQKRRDRACKGTWTPDPHPELLARVRQKLAVLRRQRNAAAAWKEACRWADTPAPAAPERGKARRRAGESDEEFAARCAKRRNQLTRREAYRSQLYVAHVADGANERSRIYWGTWNALLRSVDQARKMVLARRKQGLPAQWRRPRWDAPLTLAADSGGFRVIERGKPWWVLETRLRHGWVRFRAKCGNWHVLPAEARLRTLKLTRLPDGNRWHYFVSMSVANMPEPQHAGCGIVALDWGHREHGHPTERDGLRVFTWRDEAGTVGEILLPKACRDVADYEQELKSRLDTVWNARKSRLLLPECNRHSYRRRLQRSGVRTDEEHRWLIWEMRYERRCTKKRRRVRDIRRETYLAAIRELRARYDTFAIEDEASWSHRRSDKEEQKPHRKRQNRELSARYEFVQLLERSGATIIPVTARNSTRECPHCGQLHENDAELYRACPVTGLVDDKDELACVTILARANAALANGSASAENHA